VVLADGTQWNGVAGQAATGEAMREEHLIWIASITKTMTAAVILQLADESRLSLDDPVSRWLPPRPHVDPGITLRQLLNHTNGLDNYTASPALGAVVQASPGRVFTADDLLAFVGPPHFARGTRTEYTNTAFLLLGQVAEEASGRPIVELFHERLWDPLRLREVFLPGLEPPLQPVARALGGSGLVAPLDRMALLTTGNSAFGLLATARAVAQWGHVLFTGGVISGAMQQEMRRLVPAAGTIPGESGSGLGIRGYAYLGRTQLGHSGGASLGSSLLLHDPARGVTVVVLMNQGQGADHFTLAPALLEIATRP
jgi:D-alanyl-D-alanine carboxypeptidase